MPTRLQLASTVLMLTAITGGSTLAGQVPTFKSEVEYVEVDVIVTDDKGKPVPNLTPDDFQVFEDGKRQDISNFTVVNIPAGQPERALFQADAIVTDTASNERPFNGRLFVAVLDDINVAFLRSQQVRTAAKQFIERNLAANDLMAVVYTGGRSDWSQEFTSNKRLLLHAVDRFAGQKLASRVSMRNDEFMRQRGNAEASRGTLTLDAGTGADPMAQERFAQASGSLNAIRRVADWFGGIRGRRKTMLLFSEGIDVANDLTNLMSQNGLASFGSSGIMADTQGAIAAATRGNVSIYAIDPRGLTTMGDDDIAVSSFANERGSNLSQAGLTGERFREQLSLRTFADETGGFAVVNTNQLVNAFDRIVDENSAYYLLAYYPAANKRDGKFHTISVKTTRPGLNVRSRKGYQAPRGKGSASKQTSAGRLSPELQEALDSPIPVSGLPIRMFAAPFKGADQNASVLLGVELSGGSLALQPDSRVELTYAAVDAQGKVRAASTDTLATRLTPAIRTSAQQSGLRVLNRIPLPPGRYAIRLAARDAAAGRTGSVTYDLEVPDFRKQPLSLSGVLLTSMSGAAMVTARGDDETKVVLPASPIATRTFPQNDEIALFAEVYDNQAGPVHRVDITTTMQADDGSVVFKSADDRSSSEIQGGKGGYGYALRIPLNDVAPGAYVLRLLVRSSLGDHAGASRQLRIVVTPSASADRSDDASTSPVDR